ncbi:uncharacterized protein PpBr36_09626 [Pyricularia pennisetigena]|uniref:uncharacterized protein n=1 Tax=Pyricularia pennisetigena TaxID=1578925 RepID=UPI0011547F1F|nr:uncharacterized protein PpBr36_09626 [Pyricularia pennisetigena]TLS21686.1 hypothetical protein PpBr36_09626 [Pyricularia pennisetigena]
MSQYPPQQQMPYGSPPPPAGYPQGQPPQQGGYYPPPQPMGYYPPQQQAPPPQEEKKDRGCLYGWRVIWKSAVYSRQAEGERMISGASKEELDITTRQATRGSPKTISFTYCF